MPRQGDATVVAVVDVMGVANEPVEIHWLNPNGVVVGLRCTLPRTGRTTVTAGSTAAGVKGDGCIPSTRPYRVTAKRDE